MDDRTIVEGQLPEDLQKETLSWCRSLLEAALKRLPYPQAPSALGGRKGGVFVTLKEKGELRGCIGNFDFASPLEDSIRDMTLAAAFRDRRFPPVREEELSGLSVTISVLTPPKPISSDLEGLVIGRDGLYLIHPNGRGVLLPVVAQERGWGPQEFAWRTAIKAGLDKNAYKDPQARLMVFTAPDFSDEA
jgi:AmmeMemoRadiSam system protein A